MRNVLFLLLSGAWVRATKSVSHDLVVDASALVELGEVFGSHGLLIEEGDRGCSHLKLLCPHVPQHGRRTDGVQLFLSPSRMLLGLVARRSPVLQVYWVVHPLSHLLGSLAVTVDLVRVLAMVPDGGWSTNLGLVHLSSLFEALQLGHTLLGFFGHFSGN